MLLKVHETEYKQSGSNLQNMVVSKFPDMALFQQSLQRSSELDDDEYDQILVTFHPPSSSVASPEELSSLSIVIPLKPQVTALSQVHVNLHGSRTTGYDMGGIYGDWFSAHFGYTVKLVNLGPNLRQVLGNVAGNTQGKSPLTSAESSSSWLRSFIPSIPILDSLIGEQQNKDDGRTITFADCAPYLVVSEDSLADISRRLPLGERMDVTKFRPNIVLSGAESAWEEDYWSGLSFGAGGGVEVGSCVELEVTANCGRCVSVNVDYATGKFGKGEMGSVLKKLSVDRRVDRGNKYSPIFGRYSFLKEGKGGLLRVGDDVKVTKRNKERTIFGECFLCRFQSLTL